MSLAQATLSISGSVSCLSNLLNLAVKGWNSQIVDLKEDYGFLERKIEELAARTPLEAKLVVEKKIVHVERAITRIPDFSTEDADGKVLWLAKEGFLDDWKTEADLEKSIYHVSKVDY